MPSFIWGLPGAQPLSPPYKALFFEYWASPSSVVVNLQHTCCSGKFVSSKTLKGKIKKNEMFPITAGQRTAAVTGARLSVRCSGKVASNPPVLPTPLRISALMLYSELIKTLVTADCDLTTPAPRSLRRLPDLHTQHREPVSKLQFPWLLAVGLDINVSALLRAPD